MSLFATVPRRVLRKPFSALSPLALLHQTRLPVPAACRSASRLSGIHNGLRAASAATRGTAWDKQDKRRDSAPGRASSRRRSALDSGRPSRREGDGAFTSNGKGWPPSRQRLTPDKTGPRPTRKQSPMDALRKLAEESRGFDSSAFAATPARRGRAPVPDDSLGPPSRRKRFMDPSDPFGSGSIVKAVVTNRLHGAATQLIDQKVKALGQDSARPTASAAVPDTQQPPQHTRQSAYHARLEDEARNRAARDGRGSTGGQYRDRSSRGFDRKRDASRFQASRPPNGSGNDRPFRRDDRDGRPFRRDDNDRNPRPFRRDDRDSRPPRRAERDDRVFRPDDRGQDRPFRREERADGPESRQTRASSADASTLPDDRSTRDRRDHGESTKPEPQAWSPTADPSMRPDAQLPVSRDYTTAASQFLYGRFAVQAALTTGTRRLYKLYLDGNSAPSGHDRASEKLAQDRNVPVVWETDQRKLDAMSDGRPHNGIVLEASPLPQPPAMALGPLERAAADGPGAGGVRGFRFELGHQSREDAAINGTRDLIAAPAAAEAGRHPLVLLLDEVVDPGNLGALIRSASFLGVDAIGITTRGSATLTATAVKAAAGAAEVVPIFSVSQPEDFVTRSRQHGWVVYAAVAPRPPRTKPRPDRSPTPALSVDDLAALDPLAAHPCLLVLGNEGVGLPHELRRRASVELFIPRHAAAAAHAASDRFVVDCLNVSVAGALLLREFLLPRPRANATNAATAVNASTTAPVASAGSAESAESGAPEGDLF